MGYDLKGFSYFALWLVSLQTANFKGKLWPLEKNNVMFGHRVSDIRTAGRVLDRDANAKCHRSTEIWHERYRSWLKFLLILMLSKLSVIYSRWLWSKYTFLIHVLEIMAYIQQINWFVISWACSLLSLVFIGVPLFFLTLVHQCKKVTHRSIVDKHVHVKKRS